MSFQEKRAAAMLVSTVLTCTIYFGDVLRRYLERDANSGSEFAFWGAALLIFIPVATFFAVIVQMIFIIVNKVTTNEDDPELTDERDHLVNLKSTRNFCLVFMAGFMLSLLAVAVGYPPTMMFLILLFTFFAGGVVLEVSQLAYYRWGA